MSVHLFPLSTKRLALVSQWAGLGGNKECNGTQRSRGIQHAVNFPSFDTCQIRSIQELRGIRKDLCICLMQLGDVLAVSY